jgi:hypothetical protein
MQGMRFTSELERLDRRKTKMIVMKLLEVANPAFQDKKVEGKYLQSFDPNAYEGRGYFKATADIKQAMKFQSHKEAFEFYQTQSTVMPIRPDGKPNRPLTAFTIELSLV